MTSHTITSAKMNSSDYINDESYPTIDWSKVTFDNPYRDILTIPIRLGRSQLSYFQRIQQETGIPVEIQLDQLLLKAAQEKWIPEPNSR